MEEALYKFIRGKGCLAEFESPNGKRVFFSVNTNVVALPFQAFLYETNGVNPLDVHWETVNLLEYKMYDLRIVLEKLLAHRWNDHLITWTISAVAENIITMLTENGKHVFVPENLPANMLGCSRILGFTESKVCEGVCIEQMVLLWDYTKTTTIGELIHQYEMFGATEVAQHIQKLLPTEKRWEAPLSTFLVEEEEEVVE